MDQSGLERLINQCRSNGALVSMRVIFPVLTRSRRNDASVLLDVDAKVDAVTKLQAEFEAGVEVRFLSRLPVHAFTEYIVQIPDPDALITVLKTCLRTANQHLTTATLSAFPPLLPLLISRPTGPSPSGSQPSLSPAASTSSVQSSVVDVHTLRQVLTALLPSGGVIDRLGDSREKARDKARETLVILGGLAFRAGGGSSVLGKGGKGPETPLMILERFLREVGLASKVWRVREQVRPRNHSYCEGPCVLTFHVLLVP